MAKRESTFINMVVTLLVVTGISALALGYVYDLTKDAIAEALIKGTKREVESEEEKPKNT